MIKIIYNDILNSETQFIAHQTNCVSKGSAGVAKAIFNRYPEANTYARRGTRSTLSTIDVFNLPTINIINMNCQYYPGKSTDGIDSERNRQKSFHKCLLQISRIPMTSIAFPYGIGCGLAGGDWEYYLGTLNNFANFLNNKTEVFLYKK